MQKIILRNLAYLFSSLIISALIFTGVDCNKILDPVGAVDITGTWELVGMEGDLQDVCLGEIAIFQANNVAQLRCPGASVINRQFTYEGGILTYTETGISYNVSSRIINNIQQIVLQGRNVNRTLSYNGK